MSLPFQKFCFTWKILWAMPRILGIGLKCRLWYLVGDCFVWLSRKPHLQQSQRLEKTWQMLRASQQHSTEWNRLYWQCWHRGLFFFFPSRIESYVWRMRGGCASSYAWKYTVETYFLLITWISGTLIHEKQKEGCWDIWNQRWSRRE